MCETSHVTIHTLLFQPGSVRCTVLGRKHKAPTDCRVLRDAEQSHVPVGTAGSIVVEIRSVVRLSFSGKPHEHQISNKFSENGFCFFSSLVSVTYLLGSRQEVDAVVRKNNGDYSFIGKDAWNRTRMQAKPLSHMQVRHTQDGASPKGMKAPRKSEDRSKKTNPT